MKTLKKIGVFLLAVLVIYGGIYILHPMPFIIKLDIQSAEITDRNDTIIFKTDDPKKVDAFLDLFKYNIPYLPLQQGSSWKKVPLNVKDTPPDFGINFKNDLEEIRYSFFVRLSEPAYVEIRQGFFMPWSKTIFPVNPKMAGLEQIAGEKLRK